MKYALITGAYGGMGLATAELLQKKGYTVFALDKKVGEAHEGVIPVVADITDEKSVSEAYGFVCSKTEKIDVIIHFAGVYMLDSLVEMSDEKYNLIFDVNVRGAYIVNKIFLPLLHKNSRILLTTSELATLDPLPFTGIYAITKAALDKYAFSLAMELQLLGIKVSVLRAGAVETNMLGVSTDALDAFCKNTEHYLCNAEIFKKIVERVEARSVSPKRIAAKSARIIERRAPRFAYSINRNPLLCLLNILPKRTQLFAIRMVLKNKKEKK